MSEYDREKRYAVMAEVRRKWTDAEKQAILAEAKEGSVPAVARKHGVAANLVFRWRQHQQKTQASKKSTGKPVSSFVPAALPAPSVVVAPIKAMERGVIEIELANGHKVRVDGLVDTEALKRVLAVLAGR
jgi:transposase